jgi:glutaredoxin
MEFSVVIVVVGLVLVILGALVKLVRAFQESVWWGAAYLFIPGASIVFAVCHWARVKGSVLCMVVGIGLICGGAVMGGKGPKSLYAALMSSSDAKDIEKLTASIEEQRARIESLEGKFEIRGAELAKQFQMLDKRRKELKANDAAEVQRYNVEAEAYTAQNKGHKAIGVELESARNELSGLLDERSRLRASNPTPPAQETASVHNPASDPRTATAPASAKRVVMYTTASCPACVAAKTYLARRGVRYEERDVERSADAMKEFQSLGGRGVPLILVGNDRMVGFNPQRFEQMIGG